MNEYSADSETVLEWAQAGGGPAYDCEFIALAQMLNVKLITMESQLLKAFPKIANPLRKN
ncbi:MAG: hypothetical protein C4338_02180 [Rhodanobacteraceae bacterium]